MTARRVVVTGIGIVSSLGCTPADVTAALRAGRTGLSPCPQLREAGLKTRLYAPVQGFAEDLLDPRQRRTMSAAAMYAAVAARSALQEAGLSPDRLDPPRTAAVIGGELGGSNDLEPLRRLLFAGKKSRAGAASPTRIMDCTASGNVAAFLGLRGRCYAVSSGAGSGLASIRHGAWLVAHGLADVALCGAAEEDPWRLLGPGLERCGALAGGEDPRACRPFDAARSGFVLSAGSGILVLEPEAAARQRGAHILAEIVGAGDGREFSPPTGAGLRRAIASALNQARDRGVTQVDLIHAAANGSRIGDALEAGVLRDVFGDGPFVSATAAQTGFALGAGDALRAVLTVLMLRDGFLVPTAHLERVAPECSGLRHVERLKETKMEVAVCTAVSFASHECLILRRADG